MPAVHVCPLSQVANTVSKAGASHLVTLINEGTPVERPPVIRAENHLLLGVNDIVEDTDGLITPGADHVEELLNFIRRWDRSSPIVIHCYAGVSRSTAAAFITVCALRPDRDEMEIAQQLRWESPAATPNARIVAHGDELLKREGRLSAAIKHIGRGEFAFENEPFSLSLID